MGDIVWLASYPKSGNTWFRVLLANLLADGDEPVHINQLGSGIIASSRHAFDEHCGVASGDLTPDEIDAIRPALYRAIASSEGRSYHKVHDALLPASPGGELLIPADVTHGAVYLVRNPLDVAVSFAHHGGAHVDDAIAWMDDPARCIAGHADRLHDQVRQRLLTWHAHVASWLDQEQIPIHLVRYEDLVRVPEATFAAAAAFLGIAATQAQIDRAVHFSQFEVLQRQEAERGFDERPPSAETFFREGRVGSWRERLTAEQIATVVRHHGPMMRRLGYLDEDGAP